MADPRYAFSASYPQALGAAYVLGVENVNAPTNAKALEFTADCTFTASDLDGANPVSGLKGLAGQGKLAVPGRVVSTSPTTPFHWVV